MPVPMLDCLQGGLVTMVSENTVACVRAAVRAGSIVFVVRFDRVLACEVPSIANTSISQQDFYS